MESYGRLVNDAFRFASPSPCSPCRRQCTNILTGTRIARCQTTEADVELLQGNKAGQVGEDFARPLAAVGTRRTVDQPIFSVIVISQNDIDRIEEVIDSIISQDFSKSFEVILVNSGTDRTAEFVRERFPEVQVIHLSKPAFPGEARNAGLRVARGDYVAFVGSHVVLLPDSLQARFDAHQQGWAMVTGTVVNGTPTLSGWASYFMDNWVALPGCRSKILNRAPTRCSYKRKPLSAIGGFPEDRRAGEDTATNVRLFDSGHKAYRSADIREVHKSPCANPLALVRHHYQRGRGFGEIIVAAENEITARIVVKKIAWLVFNYTPRRIFRLSKITSRWKQADRRYFFLSYPLILCGTVSASAGAIACLLDRRADLTPVPPAALDRGPIERDEAR